MHPYVPRDVRRLRWLLRGVPIGMLTTQGLDGETRSRPMLVHEIDEDGWMWFLTDRHSRKACELINNPHATVVLQSAKGDRYVSVQGRAVVVRDGVRLRRLWNASYRSWFPRGKRDAEIALVAVRLARAEYWLVPRGRIARLYRAVKATMTRVRQESGRYGVIELATFAV
jgi:general stress protein 26